MAWWLFIYIERSNTLAEITSKATTMAGKWMNPDNAHFPFKHWSTQYTRIHRPKSQIWPLCMIWNAIIWRILILWSGKETERDSRECVIVKQSRIHAQTVNGSKLYVQIAQRKLTFYSYFLILFIDKIHVPKSFYPHLNIFLMPFAFYKFTLQISDSFGTHSFQMIQPS